MFNKGDLVIEIFGRIERKKFGKNSKHQADFTISFKGQQDLGLVAVGRGQHQLVESV